MKMYVCRYCDHNFDYDAMYWYDKVTCPHCKSRDVDKIKDKNTDPFGYNWKERKEKDE